MVPKCECGSGSKSFLFPAPNFFSKSIRPIPSPSFNPALRRLRTVPHSREIGYLRSRLATNLYLGKGS